MGRHERTRAARAEAGDAVTALPHALTFAVVLPALLVAHDVADHWVQSNHQAMTKGAPGWTGRLACMRHVSTYTATTALAVAGLWWLLGLPIAPVGFLAGQAVSAVTHYWADRGSTLRRFCDRLDNRLGKGAFYRLGAPRPVSAWTESPHGDGRDERSVSLHQAGKGDPVPWDNPSLGTGAYALDQSWHWAWLFVAALLTAVIP